MIKSLYVVPDWFLVRVLIVTKVSQVKIHKRDLT